MRTAELIVRQLVFSRDTVLMTIAEFSDAELLVRPVPAATRTCFLPKRSDLCLLAGFGSAQGRAQNFRRLTNSFGLITSRRAHNNDGRCLLRRPVNCQHRIDWAHAKRLPNPLRCSIRCAPARRPAPPKAMDGNTAGSYRACDFARIERMDWLAWPALTVGDGAELCPATHPPPGPSPHPAVPRCASTTIRLPSSLELRRVGVGPHEERQRWGR